MTTEKTLCTHCSAGPSGEGGHAALGFYVHGPYPGQRIFQCGECDERWILHRGPQGEPFAWTRYGQVFAMRRPMADSMLPSGRALA